MVFHSVPFAFLMPQSSFVAWRVAVGARVLWHSAPLPPPCRTSDRIFQCEEILLPHPGEAPHPLPKGLVDCIPPSGVGYCTPQDGEHCIPFTKGIIYPLRGGVASPQGMPHPLLRGNIAPPRGIASLSTRELCTPPPYGVCRIRPWTRVLHSLAAGGCYVPYAGGCCAVPLGYRLVGVS